MLRRMAVVPALAVALAVPSTPAHAAEDYDVLCVRAYVEQELALPGDVGRLPEVCAPLIVPVPHPLVPRPVGEILRDILNPPNS
jgi:hypothetical protein